MTIGPIDPKTNRRPTAMGPLTMTRRSALAFGALIFTRLATGRNQAAAAASKNAGSTTGVQQTGVQPTGIEARVVSALQPDIKPRDVWGADLPVVGAIVPEEDVRFLLVHHTASTNDYGQDEVIDQIRGFYEFHTSAEKGWPDVAYNFFIDRFGGIWEARAGSIDGPVRGDATGGSQGFGLLCSLIGDHSKVAVSDAAQTALVDLLAWLAERHQIDTTSGAEVAFVSRGSNRWPQGTPVVTSSISGHRDMSQTSCPGDFAYDLLPVDIPTRVGELRLAARSAVQSSAVQSSAVQSSGGSDAEPLDTAPIEAGPTSTTASDEAATSAADRSATDSPPATEEALDVSGDGDADGLSTGTAVGITAAALAAMAAGWARLRGRAEPDLDLAPDTEDGWDQFA